MSFLSQSFALWVIEQLRVYHRLPYTLDKAWVEFFPACYGDDSHYQVVAEYTLHGRHDTSRVISFPADGLFKELKFQR